MKTFLFTSALVYWLCCCTGQASEAANQKGVVVGWGENLAGQATGLPWPGLSAVQLSMTNPVVTTGVVSIAAEQLSDATAVAASQSWAAALRVNSTVVGWGGNLFGRAVGHETPNMNVTNGPVMLGGHPVSNITSIAIGRLFGLALKADGTLLTWGQNTVPPGLSNVVAISARGVFCLALKADGTVVEWVSDGRSSKNFPSGLSNVVAIAAGGTDWERCLALKRDGTVVAWGYETDNYDIRPPSNLSNVVSIAVGQGHSLAVKKDGTVVGWGSNGRGQATGISTKEMPWTSLGPVTVGGRILSNVVAVSAGSDYSLALLSNSTVVAWGNPESYYPVPHSLTNVVAIAAGERFCLAVATNVAPVVSNR